MMATSLFPHTILELKNNMPKSQVLFPQLSLLFLIELALLISYAVCAPIGICYGRVANNLPPTNDVVKLLQSNGISNIRLFNTDSALLRSFSGTGIKLMIGVPNEILPFLATSPPSAAIDWLRFNIFDHISADQIRYIAVGNEVFLKDSFYAPHLVPTILNLHIALQTLGLADSIKLSSPQAASVLSTSYPPSSASFDPSLRFAMIPLLQFLTETGSPFMVNLYPYFSYINSKPEEVSLDYALFRSEPDRTVRDGAFEYSNVYDASIDALVYAMEKEGFGGVTVAVTETGWPKSGGEAANVENAAVFNGNVVARAVRNAGTPRRPGVGVEVYLFDLFDENGKVGEEFEKHFGIFGLDGVKAYGLDFN
ncbi:glucan endo-1,3-beta-glucosidase [Cannabis sativa]|uniref:glucan endo-1,3-beta-glucosidase n=1 Tax=Cannabis sativa TaxID=3483 RepID=UPI0029CA64D9|nr:glucan endo-1,3-beta-glucosidase [Cannabis sativa]